MTPNTGAAAAITVKFVQAGRQRLGESGTGRLLSGRSILIVEDEMLVMMAAEDMLADLGCESIVVAATINEALDLIASDFIDAALLDVNLNGDRSYPVADALAATGIPFAFATGYGAHGLRDADRERPMLMKPYGAYEFGNVLKRLLIH